MSNGDNEVCMLIVEGSGGVFNRLVTGLGNVEELDCFRKFGKLLAKSSGISGMVRRELLLD